MDETIDEFYVIHGASDVSDFCLSKKTLRSIHRYIKLEQSFSIVSYVTGNGKHRLIEMCLGENVSIEHVNETSTIASIERKDETSFDMDSFLNDRKETTKRTVFFVDEYVVKNPSCRNLLKATLNLKKQRIYFYTVLQQNDRANLKKITRTVPRIVVLKKLLSTHQVKKINLVCGMYGVTVSKRASFFLAKINRGNMHALLRLLYDVLKDCKRRTSRFVQKPDAVNVFRKTRIDHFHTLDDALHSCSNVTYDTDERVVIFSNKSYSLINHFRNTCMKDDVHPFLNTTMDMKRITEHCDVFSFLDTITLTDEQTNSVLLLL